MAAADVARNLIAADAIAQLDAISAISDGDREEAHIAADAILLNIVRGDVAEAYRLCEKRCGGFWYA